MFPSSDLKRIRFLFFSITVLLLFSCSSMKEKTAPLAEKPEANKASDTDSKTAKEAVGSQTIEFSGKDPMADIQVNTEIKQAYKRVASLNLAKKYPEAVNLLDSIKSKYPQLSGPDYQKARIYFNQGLLEKALKSVDASLKNNPSNYFSLNLKGVILREQGEFEQARAIYLIAIEIYPPYPNSHLNLGILADIYMRELPLALLQYRAYMSLMAGKDKTVANWILELERRIKAGE